MKQKKDLPTISILHTGGTVASKVDYRTGAVVSKFSPAELLNMFPELRNIANIESKLVFQMFSEDMEPEHWQKLAKEIQKELKKNIVGIIITHGTDTLHYTASALSFMIQNSPIPIILVGAQRSSDRGSSDAALNLICAANFIINSDFKGIAVCMHTNQEDKTCYIHPATKVRKLHTSRRDAFKSVNHLPYAEVDIKGTIKWLNKPDNKEAKLSIKPKFEKKVVIIKIHPGITANILGKYSSYKGIILEGTGLGHLPVTQTDKYTKEHKKILKTLEKLAKKSIVVMCSQCIFGQVNMDVYSTGRDIQKTGVISAQDMLSETAYIKLGWLLGNIKNKEEIKQLMQENIVGEINKRISEKPFL